MVEERLSYIDIAKGIGIICVVIGHVIPYGPLWYFIYSFHMPLFFFISGMVCNYSKYTIKAFVYRRLKTLLIPFIFWYISQIACFFIVDNGSIFKFRALWFLWVLFLTELLYCPISNVKSYPKVIFILIGCLLLALFFLMQGIQSSIYLIVLPASICFFGGGHIVW